MAIETIRTSDEISVIVNSELDLTSIADFKTAVDRAIETREQRRLVIDLQGTNYIDSAGLEQLLIANRKLTSQAERLLVKVAPGSQPQTVLTITGFSAVMDVEPLPGID